MSKPRQVMFYPDVVKSFDVYGEEIPSLSGRYTPELKAAIEAASDESTIQQDVSAEWLNARAREIYATALERRWEAQEDNTIGSWCITVEEIPGTPADGNPTIASFVTEEHARHMVALHNETLDGEDARAPEMGERA